MSDIVERLREASLNRDSMRAGWLAEAIDEIDRLRARVTELEAEAFKLSANQCHHGYGSENGDNRCKYQDRIAELEAAQEWRPFATAPRSGIHVLCWNEKWETPHSGSCYGNNDTWAANRLAYEKGGWADKPTHWLPLPAPPKVAT